MSWAKDYIVKFHPVGYGGETAADRWVSLRGQYEHEDDARNFVIDGTSGDTGSVRWWLLHNGGDFTVNVYELNSVGSFSRDEWEESIEKRK
jgi:hypothetical protein